jgi:DhnA family fructose-bisphosphate aldolase class Ia
VVNLGIARAFSQALKGKGVCLRTDVYKPAVEGNPDRGSYRIYGADEALEIGASAMMNMLYAHHANEENMVRECAGLVVQGHQRGIPLILEALPFGIGRPADYTVENISFVTRMAAELGADVVKTAYPGNRDGFARIVDACPVPVIVLGGSAMGNDAGLLGMVEDAIAAGASGIAIGRNVWQHPNPVGIARALNAVVHAGASAAEALVLVDA